MIKKGLSNYEYHLRNRFTGEEEWVDEYIMLCFPFDKREWELLPNPYDDEPAGEPALTVESFVAHDEARRENREEWVAARFLSSIGWLGWGDYIFHVANFKSEYPVRTRADFPTPCFGDVRFWRC